MLSIETYFRAESINRLKLKGWEKIDHANSNKQNETKINTPGVSILIAGKNSL